MTRTQFPLVAGYALTVNKAQGLTVKEGVVIHLVGGKRFRPASKHGLPFVAFTRSESFAMTAFKNIPPWQDFVKGRDSHMLRMRLAFTADLDTWLSNLCVFLPAVSTGSVWSMLLSCRSEGTGFQGPFHVVLLDIAHYTLSVIFNDAFWTGRPVPQATGSLSTGRGVHLGPGPT